MYYMQTLQSTTNTQISKGKNPQKIPIVEQNHFLIVKSLHFQKQLSHIYAST